MLFYNSIHVHIIIHYNVIVNQFEMFSYKTFNKNDLIPSV